MDELEVLRYARIGAISAIDDAQNKLAAIDALIDAKQTTEPDVPFTVTLEQVKKLARDAKKTAAGFKVVSKPKKKFSAATRKRMADAQKARWTKAKEAGKKAA